MLKRFLLGLTFIAAFGAVSVGVTDTAEAWRRWRRPYVSYYAPPQAYYYSDYGYPEYVPYRSYYRSYYRPRYYGGYSTYYGYPDYYYYGPRSGVSVSFGFRGLAAAVAL
jgi:hypothetical protein